MALPFGLTGLTLAEIDVGILVLFVVLPRLILPPLDLDAADQGVARAAFMMVLLMVLGYVLAVLKIFHLAVILAALWGLRWYFFRRRRPLESGVPWIVADLLDGLERLWALVSRRGTAPPRSLSHLSWVHLGVLLTLGVAAWIRFRFNIVHAALPFSDAYETFLWMKGIERSVLFPNGLYPMGEYLIMAILHRLTWASAIPFDKLFGSTVGLSMVASVMWTTYRFTGRRVAAIAAGLLYGVFGQFLPYTEARQIATEAQEFGNMMVLPTLWFVYQAWTTRRLAYVLTSGALLAAVGLVHPIALLNAVIASLAATVAAVVTQPPSREVFRAFARVVPVAAVVTMAPMGIGLMLGIPFLATTLPFLTASSGASSSAALFGLSEWLGLGSAAAFWLAHRVRADSKAMGAALASALLLLGSVGVEALPLIGIRSLALSVRSGELVALALALAAGLLVAAVQDFLGIAHLSPRWQSRAPLALLGVAAAWIWSATPPVPLSTYTMDPDVTVAVYERIIQQFPAESWLTVSAGDYALAANQGYQMDPTVFAAHVSPRTRWPEYQYNARFKAPIYQHRLFLFVPRRVSLMEGGLFPAQQAADRRQLALITHWIQAWRIRYGPLPVYYHNQQLTVYELVNPKGGEE